MKNKEYLRIGYPNQRLTKCLPTIFRVAVLLVLSSGFTVTAQTATDASGGDSVSRPRQYLFGDWRGERELLAQKGVTFDFYYVADLLANPAGGRKQTQTGWERIRGSMDVDFGRFTGWSGLTFHVTGVWQTGVNLGADMGTLTNPSGMVSAHATRVDSFWFQQALLHNRLFLRAGQFAGLDFYGDQEYGASYLIDPLGYALGNLFPTTYESFDPSGTPAAEIRVYPRPGLYVKAAALAGNRNPYQQDPNGFHFAIRNTPVFMYEIGRTRDEGILSVPVLRSDRKTYPGIYKFGAAYNDGKFPNAAGIQSNGNYLIYGEVNQALYRSDGGSNRGLDATFAFDWSPNELNRENRQINLGARYNGPIPGRSQDGVAFGLVYTHIGDPFQSIGIQPGTPLLGSEKAIEFNYAAKIKPYILWQPVFQYYWDVGGNSRISNAAVFGFRTRVDF